MSLTRKPVEAMSLKRAKSRGSFLASVIRVLMSCSDMNNLPIFCLSYLTLGVNIIAKVEYCSRCVEKIKDLCLILHNRSDC
jgi:hypothetical protein